MRDLGYDDGDIILIHGDGQQDPEDDDPLFRDVDYTGPYDDGEYDTSDPYDIEYDVP